MSDDILTIQTQLSFQEDSLQTLNDIVTDQQKQITQLKNAVSQLQKTVESMSQQQNLPGQEDLPPHY